MSFLYREIGKIYKSIGSQFQYSFSCMELQVLLNERRVQHARIVPTSLHKRSLALGYT